MRVLYNPKPKIKFPCSWFIGDELFRPTEDLFGYPNSPLVICSGKRFRYARVSSNYCKPG